MALGKATDPSVVLLWLPPSNAWNDRNLQDLLPFHHMCDCCIVSSVQCLWNKVLCYSKSEEGQRVVVVAKVWLTRFGAWACGWSWRPGCCWCCCCSAFWKLEKTEMTKRVNTLSARGVRNVVFKFILLKEFGCARPLPFHLYKSIPPAPSLSFLSISLCGVPLGITPHSTQMGSPRTSHAYVQSCMQIYTRARTYTHAHKRLVVREMYNTHTHTRTRTHTHTHTHTHGRTSLEPWASAAERESGHFNQPNNPLPFFNLLPLFNTTCPPPP